MAKIAERVKIEGFDEMTAEEKLNALLGYEIEDAPASGDSEKLKDALSRANAQAADYKRQLREKQTEAERAEAERRESEAALREELNTLRKEKAVKDYEAQYLAAGFSAELAASSAKAQAEGDTATVLANQLAFVEETKKALEAQALGKQPPLSPGMPPKGESDDDKFIANVKKFAGL